MDGQPVTAESKHLYHTHPWSATAPASGTPRAKPTSPAESSSSSYFTAQVDLLPILFPQQLYHDKLLQYNKLVSAGRGGGGGLQTLPLPPVLSSPQTKSSTRSRSASKASNKDNSYTKSVLQSCHGNRGTKPSDTAERALMKPGKEQVAKMSARKPSEQPATRDVSARLPPTSSQSTALAAIQSSSVPSTPHQHPRTFSFESREQSPGATQNHSPRSAYSETNGNVPSLRPLPPRVYGCRFETAIPHSRRRMPYSLGTDKLEKVDPDKIKSQLSADDERKLETAMRQLYDRLLPTEAVEANRRKLVSKLEKILNDEWPGNNIQVHLFGSSGNLLCSDDSDVDICITTPWLESQPKTCMIADLLHRHGMEKIVCVASAKVPIVKIWDPELNLACDMNVNNTPALENTRMVRTYVSIDDRVRPLAMIIKYWTRRRIVNDAAFGGTLSSYTWICMIIAFLQLRDPPILPALHQRHNMKLVKPDGTRSEFADDIPKLRGFGTKNEDSLATLLFEFFRFYAHEFDYDKYALSIRTGKLLTKAEKGWQYGANNNALCIEEPFNTARNLGNTADDTSFRGLHLELRRAFDLIAEGKFEECCEQYVFPKEEERIFQKPSTVPRPATIRSSSQQNINSGNGSGSGNSNGGGRARGGGFRGSRQFRNGNGNGNGNGNRRASSSVAYETNPAFAHAGLPPTLSPADLLWYQTQSPQLISQELLSTSLGALAAQESMRFHHLYTQVTQQQQALAHAQRAQQGGSASDRPRTNSIDNAPYTAPIRPELLYGFSIPLQPQAYYHTGFTTYPSSPASAAPPSNGHSEFRRSLHRGTGTSDSGIPPGSGALRSQSQPASRNPMATSQSRLINGMSIPSYIPDERGDPGYDDASTRTSLDSPPDDDGPRFIGYYVNDHSNSARPANAFPNNGAVLGEPSQSGQGGGRRRLSTDQLPQSVLDRRMKRTSRSPSPMGHARAVSVGVKSAPLSATPFVQANSKLSSKPLVVNGTAPQTVPISGHSRPAATAEGAFTDDVNHENPLHIHQGLHPNSPWPEQHSTSPSSITAPVVPPAPERPVIVNGSSMNRSPSTLPIMSDASFQQRIAMGAALHLPYSAVAGDPNGLAGFSRFHSRQPLAPLDLAGDYAVHQDLPHLSPVYEHRTPSPTVARKFEPLPVAQSSGPGSQKDLRTDLTRPAQKSQASRSPTALSTTRQQELPMRPAPRDQRLEGLSRESGHVRSAKSQPESPNGWQKPKARKKGVADPKNVANGPPQSEQPPRNDADRKGG